MGVFRVARRGGSRTGTSEAGSPPCSRTLIVLVIVASHARTRSPPFAAFESSVARMRGHDRGAFAPSGRSLRGSRDTCARRQPRCRCALSRISVCAALCGHRTWPGLEEPKPIESAAQALKLPALPPVTQVLLLSSRYHAGEHTRGRLHIRIYAQPTPGWSGGAENAVDTLCFDSRKREARSAGRAATPRSGPGARAPGRPSPSDSDGPRRARGGARGRGARFREARAEFRLVAACTDFREDSDRKDHYPGRRAQRYD